MTEVFYDGLCVVCSLEMKHYEKKARGTNLRFVDISSPEFDATKLGLDPIQVQKVMHARTEDGEIKTGVDAFIAIWKQLPGYGPLAQLVQLPLLRPAADLGYSLFARIRPYLPRKQGKVACTTERCHIS
ncbi:MAG: DUF393 domain-containing protein [Bdellovibrionales bacterium]|nr:DUF393 domain-containing protein [Bdellovibrionales bacterium]